ncbi:MAG: hypothetical protein AAB426_14470, partial [Myxococcota bacterium]
HDVWVYHNTFRSRDAALEFYGAGRNYYSWNNLYDGTSSWAVLMGDVAGNSGISFNHDVMTSTDGAPVSKGASFSVDWTSCDSFVAGDVSGDTVGITFGSSPCELPAIDTPAAPTALAAQ